MKKLIAYALALALGVGTAAAFAADSCTGWMRQADGTWWRTCVDAQGRQYCESAKDGTGAGATRVSCK